MKVRISILVVALCMLAACQSQVNYDFPNNYKQAIVMNSLITPDEPISVTLSLTMPISSDSYDHDSLGFPISLKEPTYIDDALVIVFEDGQVLDTLSYEDGIYISEKMPKAGSQYKVEASSAKYGDCSAGTYLPPMPALSDIHYRNNVSVDEEGNPISKLYLKITDNDPARNYYKIFMGVNRDEESYHGYFPVYFSQTKNTDSVLMQSGALVFDGRCLLISDEYFSGGSYNLEAYCNWIHDGSDFSVMSLSESYYEYLRTKAMQDYEGDGFVGMHDILNVIPADIYSNVENGCGIFAGYSILNDTIGR